MEKFTKYVLKLPNVRKIYIVCKIVIEFTPGRNHINALYVIHVLQIELT